MKRFLAFLIFSFAIANAQKEVVVTDLSQNWTLNILSGPSQTDSLKSKTYQTSIPTVFHLDLLKNKDIPDPFLKDNILQVKWVSECNVKYATSFTLDDHFDYDFHQLVFEGIDTYSEVRLNGQTILNTENAFRKYTKQIKSALRRGENQLQVFISSPIQKDNLGQQSDNMPFPYAHTRKACYQYSWDWAPYLNTMGIWKKVYIESFKQVHFDYVWVRTRYISKEKATINFAIAMDIPEGVNLDRNYQIKIFYAGQEYGSYNLTEKYTYHDIQINNPKLWWPNGIGQPFIYDFEVKLEKINPSAAVDSRKIPYGIRTVQLDRTGQRFQVKVNGYSIYCKGANYVPLDMFYPRLTNPSYTPGNTIANLIDDAVDSNFNMIRLWGGGQYESEEFLELASRKGIMIFYDFMFSDSIYPSSLKFLINVEEEVKQQIRRARNYPCLTLWSGNNEILQGINDWGWSRENYRENYRKLFEVLIPKIIEYESPYIPYIPSSPVRGVGNFNFERGGDVHYWGVWAGGAEFENYRSAVGYFNSEFGTQALPVWETIVQTVGQSAASYDSPILLTHERHNSQFNTLKKYMTSYMKKSLNFQLQTYQSGLLQAYAVEIAIKAQRIAKPKSFGTLYWQLNDAWPAISWSSIDYFGRWKPLQFMAKRLYPDVAIFTQNNQVFVINDKLYEVTALAIIKFFSLDGRELNKIEKQVNLAPNEVSSIYNITQTSYQGNRDADSLIYTEVIAGKTETMSSTHFNLRFKDLDLRQAIIQVEYHEDFNEITISAESCIVKNLYISHRNQYLKVSNNYFDLVPGHPVKVIILNKESLTNLKDGLLFRSYREVYESSQVIVKVK